MSNIKAVGVLFLAQETNRYLFLMRNDPKHPNVWGLPGGKIVNKETLLDAIQRECTEELGTFPVYKQILPLETFTSADGVFTYYTWVCIIDKEFMPILNNEHLGYAWINQNVWPKPMHPGLWNTVNVDALRDKLSAIESTIIAF